MSYYGLKLINLSKHAKARAIQRLNISSDCSDIGILSICQEIVRMNCQVRWTKSKANELVYYIDESYWRQPNVPLYLLITKKGLVVTIRQIASYEII